MGIDERVAELNPTRYTTRQAAGLVNRSPDTLRRWRRANLATASDSIRFGQTEVALYTPEDIARLRVIARGMKPGPPKSDSN